MNTKSAQLILLSDREIKKMRRAGLVVWLAHQRMARTIRPGVSTAQVNKVVKETFQEYSAEPLFLNYPSGSSADPFPAETCISVNEQIVHGIPGNRKLKAGDIVSVDTGCRIDGWCGDAAYTHAVGEVSPKVRLLLDKTLQILDTAVDLLGKCQYWSEVAKQMEKIAYDHRLGIVQDLVGHGIGKNLHQTPDVPNYFNEVWDDFEIRKGLVIAVEPMINLGTENTRLLNDGWTIVTADRKPSAHFEHTLAVTSDGVMKMTGPPSEEELATLGDVDWLGPRDQWLIW